MREQSFLTAAVQNIKRLVASSFSLLLRLIARLPLLETGFVSGLNPLHSSECRGFCALMHSEIQVRGQRLVRVLEFLQAEPEVGKGNFPLAHVGEHDIAAQDAFGC